MTVTPQITVIEARLHATFTALTWSLCNPGQPQRLPTSGREAFVAIAEALIDVGTTYFCPEPTLAVRLSQTGARKSSVESARYHFYPSVTDRDLPTMRRAPAGTVIRPDAAASLVIGCTLPESNSARAHALRLRGPGIEGSINIRIGALPVAFWIARERAICYPLGWDVYLVSESRVVSLPRTTEVEVIS